MNKLVHILKQRVKPVLTLLIRCFWLFPIKNNRVLISSFSARSFSDNPKSIANYLLHRDSKLQIIVVLQSPHDTTLPVGLRAVKYNSLTYLYFLATAHIWIDNTRKQDFVIKREGQVYFQTWHGALPFKKIESDVQDELDPEYVSTAKHDSMMMDYLVTNSAFSTSIFRKCFWYSGNILQVGSPRLDQIFWNSNDQGIAIRNRLNLDSQTHYVLYAPTFRDSGNTDVYNIDFKSIIASVEARFSGHWMILARLHPNIVGKVHFNSKDIIDVSTYPDMVELFSASDVLVTDYSSSMFEFALTNKPVFLFVPDKEEYLSIRSSYFKLSELPFSNSETLDEFQNAVLKFDEIKYHSDVKNFFTKIDLVEDGSASARIATLIEKRVATD